MKQFFLKFQLLFEAVILLATLGLVFALIHPFYLRWDLTREKVYSLPNATTGVLRDLKKQRIELLLFLQKDDLLRQGLDVFLKECQRYHPDFHFDFYDPNRRPQLARKFNVTQPRTVILRSEGREERLIGPDEEDFTNAFMRLLYPKDITICFVNGHGEVDISAEDSTGYLKFREMIEGYNVKVHGIVLLRDHVPDSCQVVILGGPHLDLTSAEFEDLEKAYRNGKGLLLMIDPMDPGAGTAFVNFAKKFGVELGANVIVDKVSRLAGGDFLMPLVSQYPAGHSVTKPIKKATFFPLARSVQSSTDNPPADLEVIPLAMTGDGSWAETDLPKLENGNAVFDIKSDVAGPIPVAVAVEKKQDGEKHPPAGQTGMADNEKSESSVQDHGRMIVVGDSDFLSNAYLYLSSNRELGLNMIRWLAKDDRFLDVKRAEFIFQPLILETSKRTMLLIMLLGVFPLFFLVFGGFYLVYRSKTS